MNNEQIKTKIETLVTEYNSKVDEAKKNSKVIREAQQLQDKINEDLTFLRGKITALNDLLIEKDKEAPVEEGKT